MKTTCLHCSQHISIDPETLAELHGQEHFQCPGCNSLVAVPPMSGAASPQAASSTPTSILAHAHRGLNRNLLIFGSAALLVLGGIGFSLASRKSGDTRTEITNVNNEIIHNTYFQNLIASGKTTEQDLQSLALIRPYAGGFIGVSGETLPWKEGIGLAAKMGAEILDPGRADSADTETLTQWLKKTFTEHLSAPVWVQSGGQARILDGAEVLAVAGTDRLRRLLLVWNVPGLSGTPPAEAAGSTTGQDLEALAIIRQYENGFMGISKEALSWDAAKALAQRAGAKVLEPESFTSNPSGDLTRWIEANFTAHLAAPVWVEKNGQSHILEGDNVVSVSASNRPHKVLVWWSPQTKDVLPSGSLREGLVLHLGCDEQSPALTAKDSSGSNNHGKPSGVQWTPNGKRGGAYEFTKDGDQIVVPNNPSLNPAKLTLAAWIKTTTADGKWSRILDKSFDKGYALSIAGDWKGDTYRRGLACFETGSFSNPTPGANYIQTKTKLSDGQWHLIAATFDGLGKQLFVDGRPDGNSFRLNDLESMMSNDFDLVVGCNRSTPPDESGMSFRGIIDEPMMWNRALSPEEVRLLFESFE